MNELFVGKLERMIKFCQEADEYVIGIAEIAITSRPNGRSTDLYRM